MWRRERETTWPVAAHKSLKSLLARKSGKQNAPLRVFPRLEMSVEPPHHALTAPFPCSDFRRPSGARSCSAHTPRIAAAAPRPHSAHFTLHRSFFRVSKDRPQRALFVAPRSSSFTFFSFPCCLLRLAVSTARRLASLPCRSLDRRVPRATRSATERCRISHYVRRLCERDRPARTKRTHCISHTFSFNSRYYTFDVELFR